MPAVRPRPPVTPAAREVPAVRSRPSATPVAREVSAVRSRPSASPVAREVPAVASLDMPVPDLDLDHPFLNSLFNSVYYWALRRVPGALLGARLLLGGPHAACSVWANCSL